MDGRNCPDSPGGCGTGIDGSLDGTDLAADDCRHETRIDFFITDKRDVCGFDHRIRRLDHSYKAKTFDHSKCLHISPLQSSISLFALKQYPKQYAEPEQQSSADDCRKKR
jgi:hypothetical protein